MPNPKPRGPPYLTTFLEINPFFLERVDKGDPSSVYTLTHTDH